MASQAKFLDFIDMIDGGGAGRMGDTFEGGGIFSALANLMATPYGSEDEGRRASREAFLRSRGLLDEPAVASAAQSAAAPAMTGPTRAQRMSAAAAEMARQRGIQQDALDPRGPNQMNVPVARPNPFTGPTYDMPMARPAAGMQFGQQPAGSMPASPSGVTTRDMALADVEARKAAYEAAYPNDPGYDTSFGMEKLLVEGSRGLGDITDHLGRFSDSMQNRMYSKLLPPTPETMQYSGRGTASGNAEFDAFMNMVRNTPGQGALANDPELAFSIFQRMKAAGNLPSVMMYQ
jgi:hypothetical protein